MELRIKKTHADAITPTRQKPGDSGLDLHAYLPQGHAVIQAGGRERFWTGIAIELPEPADWQHDGKGNWASHGGFEGQVRPRSGLTTQGIVCGLGTIDNGYRGEIGVTLFNLTFRDFIVRHGDRIAQLVVAPVMYPKVVEAEELSGTERGDSGFGSTGV